MSSRLSVAAARRARDLRVSRRTRSGRRERPWREIADVLRLEAFGRHDPRTVADAVAALPLEEHPSAPPSAAVASAVECSWRTGFAEEFPGEAWPGLPEARRRLRSKLIG